MSAHRRPFCVLESMTVFLNLVQESQELLSTLRHTLRGKSKFEESKQ